MPDDDPASTALQVARDGLDVGVKYQERAVQAAKQTGRTSSMLSKLTREVLPEVVAEFERLSKSTFERLAREVHRERDGARKVVQEELRTAQGRLDAANVALAQVFDRLKASPDDLFQYVDSEAVEDLQTSTSKTISEIQQRQEMVASAAEGLELQIDVIRERIVSVVKDAGSPASTTVIDNENEDRVKSIVSKIEPQVAFLRKEVRELEALASAPTSSSVALQALASRSDAQTERVDAIQALTEEANDVFARVVSQAARQRSKYTSYCEALDDCAVASDSIGALVDDLVEHRHAMDESLQVVHAYVAELVNLGAWYNKFLSASGGLGGEWERRRAADARIAAMAEQMASKLRAEFDIELRARKDFFEYKGRFLPAELAAGLHTLPLLYNVVAYQYEYDDLEAEDGTAHIVEQ